MFALYIEGQLHNTYQTKQQVERDARKFEREGWTVDIRVMEVG